ncbi:hypothetical protein PanWU01x14_137790 [Parasponia andersonii]|uniref:Uncharacterized protein n=1 Tax=Parasponia andersonii TaxID=3476 RepID=A0A2P5CN33_PARAD|nr:hypothetical protein PanWU01x14_137790 [Parasponia andersonii]
MIIESALLQRGCGTLASIVTEGVAISNGVSRVALYGPWLRAECEVPSCFHKQQLIDKKKKKKKTEDAETFDGTTGAIVAGTGTGEYSRQRTQEIQRKDKGRLKRIPYLQEESSTFEENTAIEIQMVEANRSSQSQRKFDREKRKGVMKYRDQYQAHQALLAPAPSMEEWRAHRGLTIDGLRKSPSRKRKAQPFILPIAYPTDMSQWELI